MRPILLYLDSSDFSLLSDPRRRSAETDKMLSSLREHVLSARVVCCFSGIHLSEMAPVESTYADAAERRAELVNELCCRNAVISLDTLISAELRTAHNKSAMCTVHSSSGDWFPEGVAEFSPVDKLELAASVSDVIDEMGLNRHARRLVKRKSLKNGMTRRSMRVSAITNARISNLEEILDRYPMRPQDARVLARYVVGDASSAEAEEAFLSSLRDPGWMMKWFRQHHEKLSPFIEWIRKPAASVVRSIEAVAGQADEIRARDASLGTSMAAEILSSQRWSRWQDELLENVVARLSETLVAPDLPKLAASAVDRACPGIAACIRSLHAAWWSVITPTPRRPKLSDFPDALHAAYAPYVDIFRADAFMAPHIRSQVNRHGTTVASKLMDVFPAIEDRLRNVQ